MIAVGKWCGHCLDPAPCGNIRRKSWHGAQDLESKKNLRKL
ncbi:hypothetical protein ASAP_0168 [Asaia bogorensis]|uniref:Uncharacterized protein n=1 Tax=Asaia bogorensis TaxID=91915 RepID=A0A060QC31_9PROT|nr:hypothetical protein ASAP_0168 [Asaia bogorensis]